MAHKGGKDREAACAMIRHALREAGGRPFEAAAILGISYDTLSRLLEACALEEEAYAIRMAARREARAQKKEQG